MQEVFGFVKKNYPERSGGTTSQAEKGVGERNGSPFLRPSNAATPASISSLAEYRRFLRMESPRISMRWALMNEAIEDAVGCGGIANLFVPAGDRQLRGQNR